MPRIVALPPMNDPPESDDLLAVRDTSAENTKKVTIANLLAAVYPIGSIYVNATNATNPGTLLGFGTWVAFGEGRVMAGFNAADTDFDTAEETGGAKTYTLTSANIPSFTLNSITLYKGGASNTNGRVSANGTGGAGAVTADTFTPSHTNAGPTAINVLQPYITVYMWKRTA